MFIFAVVPILLFAASAKFDLGMAKDWDVIAPYSFVTSVAACFWISRVEREFLTRTLGVLVVVLGLQSISYFSLNASEEGNVARAKTLLDKRLVAPDGYYQCAFHLSMYYFDRQEIDSMVTVWQDYIVEFPLDGTGYRKLIQSYVSFGENGFSKIEDTFERWRKVDAAG